MPEVVENTPVIVWRNIAVLRGIAILLVVLNHAVAGADILIRSASGRPSYRLVDSFVELVARNASPFCLPAFLFASGYFMFRFQSSWESALSTARVVALRYSIWAVVGYVGICLWNHHVDFRSIALGFVTRGPFSAYWFLILIIKITLLAPWCASLVRLRPRLALFIAVLLQVAASTMFYLELFGVSGPLSSTSALRNLSFPILGMWYSAHADVFSVWLVRQRARLVPLVWLLFILTCGEAVALGRLVGGGSLASYVWSGEKATSILFFIAWLGVGVTAPSKRTAVRARLDALGLRTMAVLLLVDPIMESMLLALWQSERLLGFSRGGVSEAPRWVRGTWSTLPLFLAGLLGPLGVSWTAKRYLGNRVRKFLFG